MRPVIRDRERWETVRRRYLSSGWIAAMLSATMFWAVGSIYTKSLLGFLSPSRLLAVQLGASTLALWILLAKRGYRPTVRELVEIGWPGLLQPALAYWLALTGLQWTSVGLETTLWSAEGFITSIMLALWFKERIHHRMVVLSMCGIAGIVILTVPEVAADPRFILGNVLILAAVGCAAGYNVLTQLALRKTAPLPVLAYQNLTAFLVILPLGFFSGFDSVRDAVVLVHAALSGLLLFAVPFLLFLGVIQRVGSGRAAQFLPLVPVFTILLARFFLNESLSPGQLCGAAITVASVTGVAALESGNRPEVDSPPH